MKVTIFFIQLIWSGLLSEHEPTITASESEAFMSFVGIATNCGFRKPKKGETFEAYREDYFDFEYRYRNEYDNITKTERSQQIAKNSDWNPDDNEILFHVKEITV